MTNVNQFIKKTLNIEQFKRYCECGQASRDHKKIINFKHIYINRSTKQTNIKFWITSRHVTRTDKHVYQMRRRNQIDVIGPVPYYFSVTDSNL